MVEPLVKYSDDLKREINRQRNDPEAGKVDEAHADRYMRGRILDVAYALELANEHPQDPDCARLLAAVRATCGCPRKENGGHEQREGNAGELGQRRSGRDRAD